MVVDREGAPKGVIKGAGRRSSVWETEIEGVKVAAQYRPGVNTPSNNVTDTSLWLPCGLKVDPFPVSGMIQFEWYVPRDERSHNYIVTWGRRVANETEERQFFHEIDAVWKQLVVDKFNNEDVIAREAMERFYAEEDGWNREYLYRPDLVLTEWRKLASKHNRGIQRRPGARKSMIPDLPPGSPRYLINRVIVDLIKQPDARKKTRRQGRAFGSLRAEWAERHALSAPDWVQLLASLGALPNLVYRYYMLHGHAPESFPAAVAASRRAP